MARKTKARSGEEMVCVFCPVGQEFKTDDYGVMKAHVEEKHKQQVQTAASAAPAAPAQPGIPEGWPANVPFPGSSVGTGSAVVPPRRENYINFETLKQFRYRLEAVIKAIEPGTGRFGPGWNLRLDNGWVITVKLNGENHTALFNAFGMDWAGKKIIIQPGQTQRGSAKVEIVPIKE